MEGKGWGAGANAHVIRGTERRVQSVHNIGIALVVAIQGAAVLALDGPGVSSNGTLVIGVIQNRGIGGRGGLIRRAAGAGHPRLEGKSKSPQLS